MANTISSRTWRDKYRSTMLDTTLRTALVAEKVVSVDRSNNFRIQSPYAADPTVTVQALAGTYSVANFTTVDDTLTVTDEFIVGEHIFDFEDSLSNFDLFSARTEQASYAVAAKIDNYVLNNLCEDGTGTYTTPVGGFSTKANVDTIFSNIVGQVAGYADAYRGLFLVIENTEVPGVALAQANSGFSFADSVLKNGWITSYMGVDVYVVRSGVFADATMGTKTYTNAGHRVAGVKGVATLALPGGVKFEEKAVSGKTGMEIATYGYVGFKLWAPKTALIIDITLA